MLAHFALLLAFGYLEENISHLSAQFIAAVIALMVLWNGIYGNVFLDWHACHVYKYVPCYTMKWLTIPVIAII